MTPSYNAIFHLIKITGTLGAIAVAHPKDISAWIDLSSEMLDYLY